MIIINESYLLANIVRDNCKLVDIEIFSTKGLLNYYKIKNNKIEFLNSEFKKYGCASRQRVDVFRER